MRQKRLVAGLRVVRWGSLQRFPDPLDLEGGVLRREWEYGREGGDFEKRKREGKRQKGPSLKGGV